MKNDALDLPTWTVPSATDVAAPPRVTVLTDPAAEPGALTEAQKDRLIEAASQLAADLGAVARDVVAIYRVRADADADVARTDAETRQLVASFRGEVERLAQLGHTARARGEVVRGIVRDFAVLLGAIPELDVNARARLIETLRFLVDSALRE
jgi:hypothetical protein